MSEDAAQPGPPLALGLDLDLETTPPPVDRRTSIGASDAPAVVGVDPWRTAADVWLEKTGRVGEILAPSPAMQVGRYVEPALLAWAAAQLGEPIVGRQVRVAHPDVPELTATLDGVTASGALVEAKTAGLVGIGGPHLDAWGDAGTDAVPLHVLVQVQFQFAVCAARAARTGIAPPTVCYVPTLLARRGLVLYQLEPHAGLVAALVAAGLRFWRDYVEPDVCPPDVLPTLDVLARMRRNTDLDAVLDVPTVAAWIAARERVAIAQANEEDARRAVLAGLGDAEHGACPLGIVSYKLQTRRAYTVAASSFRRLTWSAAKGSPA